MTTRLLTSPADLAVYEAFVHRSEMGTLWQSLAWKRYQEALGREVQTYGTYDDGILLASALVVIDRTTGGLSVWDMPRGPVWTTTAALRMLLETIITDARNDKAIAVYCSPVQELPSTTYALVRSARHIQPQATRIIDLTHSESDILAQMHQKGRYNIGVAKKSGVTIRTGTAGDIHIFYALLRATAERDGFTTAQRSHYERFMTHLDGSFLLLAEYDGRAIAGLLGTSPRSLPPHPGAEAPPLSHGERGNRGITTDNFCQSQQSSPLPVGEGPGVRRGEVGIYYYGASSYEHRRLMAPYLLQWEAMRLCKAAGCTRYDLLGIATEDAGKDDPWSGISDFKRKFGGSVVEYPPEQMLVLRPMVKWGLDWKRRVLG